MLVNTIERDARNDGWKAGLAQGKSLGLAEGKSLGIAEGSRQKALETARLMKQANCEILFIEKMTGLSKKDIEAIN
ncbi:hypothetical protein [Treponema vincentii]|uniref:hypothetical protein n=1 Tax=Treponema vincentii TaxID=69710 RepID=UPI003D8A9A40